MAARKHVLPVSVPGLRALRWSSDELYVGMKESYTITRVEAGRSSFLTRGKVWSSAPGSLRIQAPGDVVRDLARGGTATYQIVVFSPRAVDGVIDNVGVHSHLEAGDPRGAAFRASARQRTFALRSKSQLACSRAYAPGVVPTRRRKCRFNWL